MFNFRPVLLASLPAQKVAPPFFVFLPPRCPATDTEPGTIPCIPCHLPIPQITLSPLLTINLSSAMKVSAWPHWWRKLSPIDCINWWYAYPHGKFIEDMQAAHLTMKCCKMCSSAALHVHCKRYCPHTQFMQNAQAALMASSCCIMCRSDASYCIPVVAAERLAPAPSSARARRQDTLPSRAAECAGVHPCVPLAAERLTFSPR